jgi:peptide/nickel transport system permease protein
MVSKFEKYVIRRILEMVPTVFALMTINFILIHSAPGGPETVLLAQEASQEYIAKIRKNWGLDRPIHEQYVAYLTNVLRGDLGDSFIYTRAVLPIIAERIGYTVWLVLPVTIGGFFFGTFLGTYTARKYPSKASSIVSAGSLVALSFPVFWAGLLLILAFSAELPLFPGQGMVSPASPSQGVGYVLDVLRHSVLPWTTLMIWNIPVYQRVAKASILEVMREDYITTARCKGLDSDVIFYKHCLRNAILPEVALVGLWCGNLLSGVLLTETIFGWPGLGRLVYQAVIQRDYNLIMGILLISSLLVVTASLITDIISSRLDPRIAYE